MAFDPECKPDSVAAGQRTMLTEPVGVFNLSEVRSRPAVDSVHEELFGFLAIFPRHQSPPLARSNIDRPPVDGQSNFTTISYEKR
jgi:hypothetical protein